MSNASHSRRNGSSDPPLQRGMACTSCRRRKTRCDGLRPTCTRRLHHDRVSDCEYMNGNKRWQARVKTLEDPQAVVPSATLTWEDGLQSAGIVYPGVDDFDLQHLVDALTPYAFDLGIFLSLPRLHAQPSSITPALRTALILCSFQSTGPSTLDPVFLMEPLVLRLMRTLVDAVDAANLGRDPQFDMQTLQAEVLLVYHLLLRDRVSDAQSYANAAMSLAVGLGLHMRLPLTGIEEQERVDACTVHITAPWPGVIGDVNVAMNAAKKDSVSKYLLLQCFRIKGEPPFGLQARASALFGEAHSVAVAYHRDPSICWSADFRNRFATLDNLIRSFFDSLLHPTALSGFSGTGGVCTSRQTLLTVNLAASALITRHRPFALSRAPSNRICVDSAIVAVLALNGLEDQKIVNIYVVCWEVFFSTLQDELCRLRSRVQVK
ncbi:hypothetical protein EDD17DRAFT_647418 [Pisolithus thermaeus]|nr:hypothetical protein EDD17DRAFT_647418 [Pisolithus thermaeus]